MRRRTLMTLGAAGLVSALPGCADGDEGKVPEAPKGPIVLGFSQVGSESGWRLANTKSIQSAARNNRIDLKFSNAEGDQAKQIAAIQSYIDARVNVISFAPVVESGWDDVLRRARDAGIPVVLTDRMINTKDESLYVSSIGAEFLSEGNLAALYLGLDFAAAAGPVNVVELLGTPDSTPTKQRSDGFAATIAREGKLRVVDAETGNWTQAGGATAMRKLLRRQKKIDAVFAQNDEMGLGAVAVLKEQGLKPGTQPRIVTVDATRAGLKALADGDLNYVVECSPEIGSQLMSVVVDLYLGGSVPKRIESQKNVFNRDTAKDALPTRTY
ncbi:ABC transporter substrate-binding protein [Actinoplanes sp. NPDC024001]|uniref:ABC transporter substrate-binding protein n=1 Tax=Actinoplanes sp. NPDC024001 TaxID=3154598 RepID=UPI0033F4DC8A